MADDDRAGADTTAGAVEQPSEADESVPRKRGFAAMTQERRRGIAASGGRALHRDGHAHYFTSEEAQKAGRKGGRTLSADRIHMAKIGRLGGQARGRRARKERRVSLQASNRNVTENPPSAVVKIHLRASVHIHFPAAEEARAPPPTAETPKVAKSPPPDDGWPADPVEFGNAVERARDEFQLSRAALSRVAGISAATVRNVERARHSCRPEIRAWIIGALAKLRSQQA